MVIGSDQLKNLQKWKNYKQILNLVKVITFNRKDENFVLNNSIKIKFIDNFDVNISSTMIRNYLIKNCGDIGSLQMFLYG